MYITRVFISKSVSRNLMIKPIRRGEITLYAIENAIRSPTTMNFPIWGLA